MNPDKDQLDYKITKSMIFDIPESDRQTIIDDYNVIVNKIRNGKAHELSESDTLILGACTKGADGTKRCTQPFSDELAKPRAFCLKTGYMTQLVRRVFSSTNYLENDFLHNESLTQFLVDHVDIHIGKTRKKLCEDLGIKFDTNNYNLNKNIIQQMFGSKKSLDSINEFKKYSILAKTVRINAGKVQESLPLQNINYKVMCNETFEESDFSTYIEDTKLLVFIFNEYEDDYKFCGKLFVPLGKVVEQSAKFTWEKTQNIVENGNIVQVIKPDKNGKIIYHTNFPDAKSEYFHVRPRAANGDKTDINETLELPTEDKVSKLKRYTRHAFWFNQEKLSEIIENSGLLK